MTALLVAAFPATFAALMIAVGITVRRGRIQAVPEPVPDRLVCDLEYCNEPSAVLFDGGLDGLLYICAKDAPKVSEWAMVVGVRGDAA
jgi:hypothetical protein